MFACKVCSLTPGFATQNSAALVGEASRRRRRRGKTSLVVAMVFIRFFFKREIGYVRGDIYVLNKGRDISNGIVTCCWSDYL